MALASAGRRRHFVGLENPDGDPVSNGDGEYTQPYEKFADAFASIETATEQKLERFTLASSVTSATHILTIPFRNDVTTKSRVRFGERIFTVVGYADPEERNIDLVLVCQELKES